MAVTRAEDELYLCYPLLRFTQAQGMMMPERSRFLDEVPRELLEEWNLRPSRSMDFGTGWPRGKSDEDPAVAGEDSPFLTLPGVRGRVQVTAGFRRWRLRHGHDSEPGQTATASGGFYDPFPQPPPAAADL